MSDEPEPHLELRVTFGSEGLVRDQTENLSHREYLVTRGVPVAFVPYSLRRTQIITPAFTVPTT